MVISKISDVAMTSVILVVEDDADIRSNVCDLLQAEGFDVLAAENGRVGTQMALEALPDLILCDISMPELDGYSVINVLQNDEATRLIPLIFLSAKADRSDLRKAMVLGADDYLTKPFTVQELLQAVHARLRKKALLHNTLARIASGDRPGRTVSSEQEKAVPLGLASYPVCTTLAGKAEEQGLPCAPLLLLEIDQIKRVCETFGHTFSDELMTAIRQRLQAWLSEHAPQQPSLAPISYNQVVISLAPFAPEQQIEVVQGLLQYLKRPFSLRGHQVSVTGRAGLSSPHGANHSFETLFRQAEIALQAIRGQSAIKMQRYSPDLKETPLQQLFLETSMPQALLCHEFSLYYQPQVDCLTHEVVGCEALLRWHSPTHGPQSPALFIPIAEESGFIVELGQWVLHTACQQAKLWHQALGKTFKMSVNVSVQQLSDPNFVSGLKEVLATTGIEAACLVLELTEGNILPQTGQTIAVMQDIQALGVQIAIDDFGVGYSALSYLRSFPLNTLKIDQCFARGIDANPENAVIVKAIVELAHQLRLTVVAEGVETLPELTFLKGCGCDQIQGYLISCPLPDTEFAALLTSNVAL